jgi:hypothetical protein
VVTGALESRFSTLCRRFGQRTGKVSGVKAGFYLITWSPDRLDPDPH